MHGTFGSVAIRNGLVIVLDVTGSVHCLDEKRGNRYWTYDTLSMIFGSPLILGRTIILASEDGEIILIPLSGRLKEDKIQKLETTFLLHSSPVYANNVVYFNTYSSLIAIPCEDFDELEETDD